MPVKGLEHFNIRTDRVGDTVHFFRDVLGMSVQPVPGRSSIEDSAWVYSDDGVAVVHIGSVHGTYPGEDGSGVDYVGGAGAIHHVALNCTDYDFLRAHLERHQLEITPNDLPQFNLRQIFVRDPNDILIELNFHGTI